MYFINILFVLLEWQKAEQVYKYAWFEEAGMENTDKEGTRRE